MTWIENFKNTKDKGTREYEANAIIGDKRQGKTTLAKLLIENYHRLYPWRRVLIYDISNAFKADPRSDFKGYPIISLEELREGKRVQKGRKRVKRFWKKGIRRLMDDYDYDEVLEFMAQHFTNGLIVIDEATLVMTDNPNKARRAIMTTHTNNKTDIYMIFHALSFVPKRLRAAFWNYYIFKTPEQIENHKELQKMGFPNAKVLFDAWKESQRAPHREDHILQYFTCFSRNFQHNK